MTGNAKIQRWLNGRKMIGCLPLIIFFLVSCENDPKEIRDLNSRNLGVEEAVNVNINYTIGGKVKAILSGPRMLRVQDTLPYVEFPNTIHVDFYNGNDTLVESTMDAHYAKYLESQSKVFLKDSVRVINIKNGDTLYCRELWWDRARTGMEFFTDKPIRIRTRTHTLDGVGMESRQDFVNWHILQPVGIIKVPSSEFPN